jgi:proteic killer suppression protein
VIVSFRCRETEKIFHGQFSRKFAAIERPALRKLTILDAAENLSHLDGKGNSLEALKKDRTGQYAIRVNDQYRICFRWANANANDVEIVDYHD